jgi:hypothetical protein
MEVDPLSKSDGLLHSAAGGNRKFVRYNSRTFRTDR